MAEARSAIEAGTSPATRAPRSRPSTVTSTAAAHPRPGPTGVRLERKVVQSRRALVPCEVRAPRATRHPPRASNPASSICGARPCASPRDLRICLLRDAPDAPDAPDAARPAGSQGAAQGTRQTATELTRLRFCFTLDAWSRDAIPPVPCTARTRATPAGVSPSLLCFESADFSSRSASPAHNRPATSPSLPDAFRIPRKAFLLSP
jgi:hypothetical protein